MSGIIGIKQNGIFSPIEFLARLFNLNIVVTNALSATKNCPYHKRDHVQTEGLRNVNALVEAHSPSFFNLCPGVLEYCIMCYYPIRLFNLYT